MGVRNYCHAQMLLRRDRVLNLGAEGCRGVNEVGFLIVDGRKGEVTISKFSILIRWKT
jgi:hypothetical protein